VFNGNAQIPGTRNYFLAESLCLFRNEGAKFFPDTMDSKCVMRRAHFLNSLEVRRLVYGKKITINTKPNPLKWVGETVGLRPHGDYDEWKP